MTQDTEQPTHSTRHTYRDEDTSAIVPNTGRTSSGSARPLPRINSNEQTLVDFVKSDDPDLFAKTTAFTAFLDDWKSKGTYSYHRLLTSACGSRATIFDPASRKNREMLVFASNNYLGLNSRPELIAAVRAAVTKYGTGMCGSRFLSGTYDLVTQLERELAEFEHVEEVMVFTTGYQANVGTISALMRPGDVAFVDRLCHASILDGCHMSGCQMRTFKHNDMDNLESLIRRSRGKHKGALIIVDGVFSMDGDLAPLPDIVALAEKYDARTLVDEAHGTGVIGPNGRGALELFGLEDRVDIVLGTFSKTFSSTGGFIGARRDVITYVRHYGRSYMFSASPTPAVVAAVLAGLKIVKTEPQLRDKLWENIRYLHANLKTAGFDVFPDPPQSGIITIRIGPDDKVRSMSRDIYSRGIFISTGCYPAVAQGDAKLRLCVSAGHSRADLDTALEVLSTVGNEHNVI